MSNSIADAEAATVEGLGFAIPSASIRRLVNDLLTYGEVRPEPSFGVTVLQTGTRLEDGKFLTSGGRVLGVTAVGSDLSEALARSYAAAEKIVFEGVHYRKDIGKIKK